MVKALYYNMRYDRYRLNVSIIYVCLSKRPSVIHTAARLKRSIIIIIVFVEYIMIISVPCLYRTIYI